MRKPGTKAATNGLETSSSGAHPFLTDEQRVALDEALAKKKAEQPPPPPPPATAADEGAGPSKPRLGKNPHHERVLTKGDLQHDHHLSRKGKGAGRATAGKTKKAGAGGKFTWGSMLADQDAAPSMDRNDPNYDSDEEEAVDLREERTIQIAAYKRAVSSLLEEYYNSGDLQEAAARLVDLDHPQFGHYFVKRLLTTAMDKHDREREMTSQLLSALYNEVIAPDRMRKGFLSVVEGLEDLRLDVPDALDLLSLFVCRAVTDDVLPPSFVKRIDGVEGSLSVELQHKCEAHLSAKHGVAERLARCWGSGAGSGLDETKASIASMLKEYAGCGDVGEVRRLLRDLAVPFFHHELVKQALLAALDGGGTAGPMLCLLRELAESGDVSASQIVKGFQRVAGNLADIELDAPGARATFDDAVNAAAAQGWLEEGFSTAPTSPSTPGTPGFLNGVQNHFHPSVQAFKAAALDIVREYFDSGDAAEVGRRLADLDEPGFHNIFVKHAVQLSMDRRDRERELTSSLLPQLMPGVVSPDQASLGFTRLLAGADDLALDIPDAAHLLSLFLGRAVVDEVLPPRFLAEVVPHLQAGSLGVEIVQAVGSMLSARHAGERLAACWHGGASNIAELRRELKLLLKEYVVNGDVSEAEQCLAELGVPHYHHELVYQALLAVFDSPANADKIMSLLRTLAGSGEITQTQLATGFARVENDLPDVQLDYTAAGRLLPPLKAQAEDEGWLGPPAEPVPSAQQP